MADKKSLQMFLRPAAQTEETLGVIASTRFVDPETKAPAEWRITSITAKENDELIRQCRRPVRRKGSDITYEVDSSLYSAKLAVRCTVFPDLCDAELIQAYGAVGPEELIRTMLKPGEYTQYVERIVELNGFDQGFEELQGEAKN